MTLTPTKLTGTTYDNIIKSILKNIDDPIIFNLFSDGGKQSVMMHDFCKEHGQNTLSIAVSQDEKYRNAALSNYQNRFSPTFSLNEVIRKHELGRISYFIDPSFDFTWKCGGLWSLEYISIFMFLTLLTSSLIK